MNFIFISPQFPFNYWNFCDRLKRNGVRVLGIGDTPYDQLGALLRSSLTEYYLVRNLSDYDEVYRAVAFFAFKYGRIDWIESNNEYWLEQDAHLRTDFNITTGIGLDRIIDIKSKASMKIKYSAAHIPSARQIKLTTLESALVFGSSVGYPLIIKPEIGVGATDVHKILNARELCDFFQLPPQDPHVIEQFIDGDIVSYDAIADSHGVPLFESMTVWPPSVADIVNQHLDLGYYVCPSMPKKLRMYGRRCIKVFGAERRFVHMEFFVVGDDFVALEVNMRPAGGYTPDLMNWAHSTDVYQIWADMVAFDARHVVDCRDDHYCVYAARRDEYKYVHTHEAILNRYGSHITMHRRNPPLFFDTMGNYFYVVHAWSECEVGDFIHFVQEKV